MTPKTFKKIKRRAVNLSNAQLTKQYLFENSDIPFIIEATQAQVNFLSWSLNHRELINTHLQKRGPFYCEDFR